MDKEQLFENQQFLQVIDIAQKQLSMLNKEAEIEQEDIISAKKELHGETSHSISNLWHSDNFEQLVEFSQFATMVSDNITSYETTIKRINQLEMQLNSPYFARIDFIVLLPPQNAAQLPGHHVRHLPKTMSAIHVNPTRRRINYNSIMHLNNPDLFRFFSCSPNAHAYIIAA